MKNNLLNRQQTGTGKLTMAMHILCLSIANLCEYTRFQCIPMKHGTNKYNTKKRKLEANTQAVDTSSIAYLREKTGINKKQ